MDQPEELLKAYPKDLGQVLRGKERILLWIACSNDIICFHTLD
jgi:hypothetical protein